MAGRPRLYADAAAKTRAYREREEQRSVKWDRSTAEAIESHLKRLRLAVVDAQSAGDPLACSLDTITVIDLLSGLSAHFEAQAAACAPLPVPGSIPTPSGRKSQGRR